jgi:membrane-bound lytic murein transglycosylase D
VPAFIAAVYVMNYAKEHNLRPIMPRAIFNEIDTIHIRRRVSFTQLANVLDMPVEDIAFLNPTYLLEVIPETESHHVLTLPRSKVATFINNEETIYNYRLTASAVKADTSQEISQVVQKPKTHTVRSGESISMVARKYGVTVADLKKWNNLRSSRLVRGQRLKVSSPYKARVQEVLSASGSSVKVEEKPPAEGGSAPAEREADKENNQVQEKRYVVYKVRSGDTQWKIAVNHGMTLNEFRKLNGFSQRAVLKVGMKVKVKPRK